MSNEAAALVSALEIRGLFGHKDLYIDLSSGASPPNHGRRLSLLYGNNGSGKTTALRLLWHALSPSATAAHRSELSTTPFDTFRIELCSGDVIKFSKLNGPVGAFNVTVTNDSGLVIEQTYEEVEEGIVRPITRPSDSEHRNQESLFDVAGTLSIRRNDTASLRRYRTMRRQSEQLDRYAIYLGELGTGPYLLADDRKIYGDGIESDHTQRNRQFHLSEFEGGDPTIAHGVPAELNMALERVFEAIQSMIITGNVSGSRDSNKVYLGILKKVSESPINDAGSATREELQDRLEEIAEKTKEFSAYGLMPIFRHDSFVEVLNRTPDSKLAVAEDVMQPFLDAQEARLNALSDVAKLISTLTREVNRFLNASGKKVTYKAHRGLRVTSEDGSRLQPEHLSSGERQILLLLLNTVLARHSTRLFLIDEPELSLNVKWQRQLMSALLSLTEGSQVQFIVATHSIEVLTGHRDAVAKVTPRSISGAESARQSSERS